jgi:hypothetical protein
MVKNKAIVNVAGRPDIHGPLFRIEGEAGDVTTVRINLDLGYGAHERLRFIGISIVVDLVDISIATHQQRYRKEGQQHDSSVYDNWHDSEGTNTLVVETG